MLTTFNTDDYVLRALKAGARGFLLKDTSPAEMLDAIRRAAAGEPVLSPQVAGQVIAAATAQERVDTAAKHHPGTRRRPPARGGQVEPGHSPRALHESGDGESQHHPDLPETGSRQPGGSSNADPRRRRNPQRLRGGVVTTSCCRRPATGRPSRRPHAVGTAGQRRRP